MRKLLPHLLFFASIFLSCISINASNSVYDLRSDYQLENPGDTIFVTVANADEHKINQIKNDLVAENFVWIGYCESMGAICVRIPLSETDDNFKTTIKQAVMGRYTIYPLENENFSLNNPCFYQ